MSHTLNLKKVKIVAHPYVTAFFSKGIISKRFKWYIEHRIKVTLVSDPALHYGEFHIFDENDEEITPINSPLELVDMSYDLAYSHRIDVAQSEFMKREDKS